MRVSDAIIEQSFQRAGITRRALHDALRIMCPSQLKGYDRQTTAEMRNAWQPDNPTRFCCYFVSEMVYWYCTKQNDRIAMSLSVPGDATLHRFVDTSDGIIDVTCDQFEDYSLLDYSLAKPRMFLQTGGVGPSKRAKCLAGLLGLHA